MLTADARFSDKSINIGEVKDCLKVALGLGGSILGYLQIILSSKDHSSRERVHLSKRPTILGNMSTNKESSGSSELHLAVAAINTPLQSSPGEESHSSNMHESLVRRAKDDHKNAHRMSRSLGPYQSSKGASDLSGLEAGRYELGDEEHLIMTRRGRFQELSGLGQGLGVQQVPHLSCKLLMPSPSK